jgi:hypothetical protein
MFRPRTKLTPYELWNNKNSTIKYFRMFESSYYILRYWENLYQFDSKSDKELFLKYSSHSKAYIVYNLQTQTVMKSINVVINDNLKEYVKKNLN